MPSSPTRRFETPWWLALACLLAAAPPAAPGIRFVDATDAVGMDFVHERGVTGSKHLPETMGSGVAWIDYDGDGDYDLYLVQSGNLPGTAPETGTGTGPSATPEPGNVMFRNEAGRLTRVRTGAEHRGYGMGVAAADWDGDGFTDLFVSNFGADVLLRNNGDGSYSEMAATGVEDPRWSSSAAWSDFDLDGLPDLYVAKYVQYDPRNAVACGEQQYERRSYCHIDLFRGEPDTLYRNRGDGSFEDRSISAGVTNALEGKGLGVVVGDVDADGYPDVYVANDTQQNFLYVNRGDWTFDEQGLFSGTGYSESGTGLAGMGTDMADLDGDGRDEILVTNFAFENNNLYREVAPGAYLDDSSALGLAAPGFATLSFGIVALDADGDGDAEIAVANGHILDNVDEVQDNTTYAQRNHLFNNHLTELRATRLADGGEMAGWRPEAGLLTEISQTAGTGFEPIEVSRGLAVGDLDGDGWPDLAVTNSGGPARLLANRSVSQAHRLVVRLRGRSVNRGALDARVTVTPQGGDVRFDGAAGLPQVQTLRSGISYLSQTAADLYYGLATSTAARVEVHWPDGTRQTIESVDADTVVLIVQSREVLTRPLAPHAPGPGGPAAGQQSR